MTARIVFCFIFFVTSILTATAASQHAETLPTPQEKAAVDRLKRKFSGKLLDKDFKTLRELSESPEYLQFLSEVHPPEYLGYLKESEKDVPPFKTFRQFVKTALPPRARYFKFFQEQLFYTTPEDIQVEGLAFIHLIATEFWGTEAEIRSGTSFVRKRPGFSTILSQPDGIKWLAQKGIIEEEKEKLLPSDWTHLVSVFMHLSGVAASNQSEDIRWIKTLFSEHGEDEGLLWLAVQDPFLFDRVLYVFHDPDTFLKWLDTPADAESDTSPEKSRKHESQKIFFPYE